MDRDNLDDSSTSPIHTRIVRASSFHQEGQEQGAIEDSDDDFSDPEDTQTLQLPTTASKAQPFSTEQDRAKLWLEITDPAKNYKTLEDFKTEYEERLKRCCGPDGNDKNKTILHWLPSQLWDGAISQNHLEWLVATVVACNPRIISQRTNDAQKNNCLHVALEQKRFALVRLICQHTLGHSLDAFAVREALSQGNQYKENPLHMAIRQDEPDLSLIQFLVESADKEAISMQRLGRGYGDGTEDSNTTLHDLVHIDRVSKGGYMKVLAQTVEKCPEALKISNRAKETPYLFHISTRNRNDRRWADLEFSKVGSSTARQSKKGKKGGGSASLGSEDKDLEKVRIAKVGSYLLDQCCSRFSYEEACICLYGDKQFHQNVSFQPASPVDLRTEVSHSFLEFYPILSYVELTLIEPQGSDGTPRGASDNSSVNSGHSVQDSWIGRSESARKTFEWLRQRKRVRRILKLVVIDDANLPCSDAIIEDCLQGFDVRYLNWNKEDLCVETLRTSGTSNVKELWLSWSGRNSVLHGWSCKETGLPTLSQLDTVHIEAKIGIEPAERDTANLKSFKRRLQKNTTELQFNPFRHGMANRITAALEDDLRKLGPKLKEQMLTWTGSPNYAVMARVNHHDPPPSLEATISFFDARVNDYFKKTNSIREIKVEMSMPAVASEGKGPQFSARREPGHRWIDAARRLATAIGKVAANNVDRTAEMRPIKVAIIDDGVTPGRLSRPSALKDGWPFPGPRRTENRSKPYYHSEKGHGTKMARLIQMMCPYVSFYVAKVDMHRENNASVASSAAQAVKWAVEKQVDIISMSWTVKKAKVGTFDNGNGILSLETEIQGAAKRDILMFCAVQDGAHYEADEVYPSQSDTRKLLIVGSADENGERSTFVNKNSADHLFPGEVSLPSILNENDKGSSVATAVAAGMAAMILWCAEFHSLGARQGIASSAQAAPRASESSASSASVEAVSSRVRTHLSQEAGELPRRTATEWDFRRDRRMNALFDALKPADDRFVDMTNVINGVLRDTDESFNDAQGAEKTCIGLFVERCKENLPAKLR